MASDPSFVNLRSLTIHQNAGNPKFILKDAQGVEYLTGNELSPEEIILQTIPGVSLLRIVKNQVYSPTGELIGNMSAVLKTSKKSEKVDKKKQLALKNEAGLDLLVMTGKSKDKKGGGHNLQMNIRVPKGEKVKKPKEEKSKEKGEKKKKGNDIAELSGNSETGYEIEFDKNCVDPQAKLNAIALVISFLELESRVYVLAQNNVEAEAPGTQQPYGWVTPTQ